MLALRRTLGLLLLLPWVSGAVWAAPCDPDGVDEAALRAAWARIDATCDCDAAPSRRQYIACATAAVKTEVATGGIPASCRKVARKRASLSVCGRPEAMVCCRTSASGIVKGRIVGSLARCTAPSGGNACVAMEDFVADGCSESGCASCAGQSPIGSCGDAQTECDMPGVGECSERCRLPRCGNCIVEPGETCEAPGSPGCTDSCDAGSCPPAPAGEITIACGSGVAHLDLATGPTGYLAAWGTRAYDGGPTTSPISAVRARYLDSTGVPTGTTPFTVTDLYGLQAGGPVVAGDDAGWYVGWRNQNGGFFAVRGVHVDAGGVRSAAHELRSGTPFGTCQSGIEGPLAAVAEGARRFAVSLRTYTGCAGTWSITSQFADRVTFAGDAAAISYLGTPAYADFTTFQPGSATGAFAAVAHGGDDTTMVVRKSYFDWTSGSPVVTDRAIVAHWLPIPDGSTRLSSIDAFSDARIGAAFGTESFLAAWVTTSVTGREVRVTRFTRDGALDPDGGVVLVSSGPEVYAGPAVAFDGTTWLVAWTVARPDDTFDVLGTRVLPDGTVVDAVPRLLAAGVLLEEPRLVRRADGWLLTVTRTSGSVRSVNLVPVSD